MCHRIEIDVDKNELLSRLRLAVQFRMASWDALERLEAAIGDEHFLVKEDIQNIVGALASVYVYPSEIKMRHLDQLLQSLGKEVNDG